MNCLEFILDLVSDNLAFFSFEEEFSQGRYKRFSELAIFMHYASSGECDDDARHRAVRSHLAEKMEKVFPDDIFRNFYTSYHIIMPYAYIRDYHTVDMLEKSLDIVCEENFFSPEIPAHRQMEWELMLYKLGRRDSLGTNRASILCRNCFLPYLDRDLVYAMTHAIFYLTDFGFCADTPEGIDIDRTLFRTACLIARFREEKDVDVVLELVISFMALYPFASDNALADLWLADVIVVAEWLMRETNFLTLDYPHIAGIDGILEEKYHTLFVLGILHALLKKLDGRSPLPEFVAASVFLAPDITVHDAGASIEVEKLALMQTWRIIDSLKAKAYSKTLYESYKSDFGRSKYLEEEITAHVSIMKRRNQNAILWNQEFTLLSVPPEQQQVLSAESHADLMAKMKYEDA